MGFSSVNIDSCYLSVLINRNKKFWWELCAGNSFGFQYELPAFDSASNTPVNVKLRSVKYLSVGHFPAEGVGSGSC